MAFTHLQVRSGFSFMKSTIAINKLVEEAKEKGFESVALTDEGVMHGSLRFYLECKQRGLKPILGMILQVQWNDHTFPVTLLAKNHNGFKHLLKISSLYQQDTSKPFAWGDMEAYINDLVTIIPVIGSPLQHLLESEDYKAANELWRELNISNDTYIGIQHHGNEKERGVLRSIKPFAETYHIPVTAMQDVRYLDEKDDLAFECLLAMKDGRRWSPDPELSQWKNHHLASPAEMEDRFGEIWPDALESAVQVASRCNVEIPIEDQRIPRYPCPDNKESVSYLKELCVQGLKNKYADNYRQAKERLEYELKVITKMQFSDYFLIVWDFISYAKNQGIVVGPGRGSAAGSIVAYLLGITDVDPLKYDLLFERFLNPERVSMPDIDIDFSDHKRDEVIRYVNEKYGADRVAQIVTFGTFAARSLLRELFKTIGIDQEDISFIMKEFPKTGGRSIVDTVKASEELAIYIRQSPKLKRLFAIAAKLEGLPRHASTHAAGVIISDRPLIDDVATMPGYDEVRLTQYPMGDLEAIGLLKMDFLGLRNLSLIERIEASIQKQGQSSFLVESIPDHDEETYRLLREGRTNGVFQLESQGMKSVLKRLKPNRFEDIVAVNALYRPGPMEYIQTFINRKNGKESVKYPHADVAPILERTFGVLVYQEQIMQVANKIAGFSLGQADLLRRAVSKKQKGLIEEQRKAFIQGSREKGYPNHVAEELYDWIVRFSNYGFNRSHAVAYSMISYQLAYLKAHFPAQFLAELMNSTMGSQEKLSMYVQEAKENGITVLPPSINASLAVSKAKQGHIRLGLLPIKGVGYQAIQSILETRKNGPFKNLYDFCLRVPMKTVNRSVMESLILAGAFDDNNPNRASLLASIDQAIDQGELFREFDDQPSFFQNEVQLDVSYIETEPFPQLKQLALEKEVLGIYLSSHPLETYRASLRENGFIAFPQLETIKQRNRLKACAVVDHIKQIRTKRGDPMAFMSVSDEHGEMETVIFPELYRDVRSWLSEGMLISFEGKVEERNGQLQWLLASMEPFDEKKLDNNVAQKLFIRITEQEEYDALQAIRQIAAYFPGNTPVIVHNSQSKKTYQLSKDHYVQASRDCLKALTDYFGKDSVALRSNKNL